MGGLRCATILPATEPTPPAEKPRTREARDPQEPDTVKLFVAGAAGRTGREIVEQALGHGHDVVALVHAAPLELTHPRLEVFSADVRDMDAMGEGIAGCDAVAFAVGGGKGGVPRIHDEGMAAVVYGMALQGVRKLAAVSAAGTFARTDPRVSIKMRAAIATSMRHVYDDLEAMERRIMASDLDWTIVKPVGLSDGPFTGAYRISPDGSLLPKTSRISRADVAAFALKALETSRYDRKSIVIAD